MPVLLARSLEVFISAAESIGKIPESLILVDEEGLEPS